LHGYRLTFLHPKTKEQMLFYASIPDYFMTALKKAGEKEDGSSVLNRLVMLESNS